MRLPVLRVPRPSFEWLEAAATRTTLLYALYTGVLFSVFLLANFPHGAVVQRVLRTIDVPGLRIDVGGARFAWWRGIELQDVRVAPLHPEQPDYFRAEGLYLRPGFDGLLDGQVRSFHISGPTYGGGLDGSFHGGQVNRATVSIDGLQLQRYPLLASLLNGGHIAGRLSGAATLEAPNNGDGEMRAAGELTLSQGSMVDAKWKQLPVPALHFDTVTLKFSLQGSRLEIQELDASGPELKISGSGQIALRPVIADSVLNLKVSIAPGNESPETITALLALLPPPTRGAKPDAPRVLSGTLAKPRLR
ncbi:MAG: type II secretion system protein GspN [Candidatus Binatia bacterium]